MGGLFTVRFSDEEMVTLRESAMGRQKAKVNATNKKYSNRNDLAVHLTGVAGEVAFARWTGGDYDNRFYSGGDPGHDAVIGDGTTKVDVKSRKGKYRDLAVHTDLSDIRANIAVLCWVTLPEVFVVGWVERDDIKNEGYVTEFIPGQPRLVVRWQRLNPLWQL
jgi:hypothetical protein